MRHSRSLAIGLLFAAALSGLSCARSDAAVRDDVVARLGSHPETSGLDVGVDVRRRIVFLTGRTGSVEEQQRVLGVVEGVEGVLLVVNDIVLYDAGLARRVQAALAEDPLLASARIDVEAQDGVARLMSDATTREQRERAVQVAASVEGVKKVEDRMK